MRSIMKWLIENKELIGLVVSIVVSVSLAAYLLVTNPEGLLEGMMWYVIWRNIHKLFNRRC